MLSYRMYIDKNIRPYDAAVIGGGITGLVAAFQLIRDSKCTKVTLYEKSPRLGGFLQSETINVDGGRIVFEHGPRTLRATAEPYYTFIFADLLYELNLANSLARTPKRSPAADNRYIYYPDHLACMPGFVPGGSWEKVTELYSRLREPIFRGALWAAVREPFKRRPPICPDDESIGEFISRRFSKSVADNLVSAVFHGIYAGDIYKLSAYSLMRTLYEGEALHGSIIKSLIMNWRSKYTQMTTTHSMAAGVAAQANIDLGRDHVGEPIYKHYMRLIAESSVFTFEHGMSQLVDALLSYLKKSEKVEIITGAEVSTLTQSAHNYDLTVGFAPGKYRVHDRVIATNPAPDMVRILTTPPKKNYTLPQASVTSLKTLNYAVSVMVVNLYYSTPNLVPVRGFGYLIPRSVPKSQNPEGGLGVIFASETSRGQDTAPGTKLTVMLGGHLWDGFAESDYPDHEQAVTMARSLLQRHLGITEAPTISRSRLQRNAIPQYTVGHALRIREIRRSVRSDFRRRLTLAGNWYDGVGVPDCIIQGYTAAAYGTGRAKISTYDDSFGEFDMEGGLAIPYAPSHPMLKEEYQRLAE